MKRAIETDDDYKNWFGKSSYNKSLTNQERQKTLSFWENRIATRYANLHTTNPKIYWAKNTEGLLWHNISLNPKVQLKDSSMMGDIWSELSASEQTIRTCADWMQYITNIPSSSACDQSHPTEQANGIVEPNEKLTIAVYSDANDFDGQQTYFRRSLLSFMVLHNDGTNVILAPLLSGTVKFPFENNVEELNYPHAEDVFVTKLCSAKSKEYFWANELFVVNIDWISGQPENSRGGTVFDDELKFGDFIHAKWDFNTNESSSGMVTIAEAILGDDLVYDLIPKTELYVGGNLIEKMLTLTNHNYNMFAMLDLMNELTHQSERVIATHTVSTTTKVKTSWFTFIPSWKDNRPKQIVDLTDGEYVMYSDVFRCPVCNVKVKVICKGSNRKSQAECPLCKKGKIEFPHLVNEEGVEEE